MPLLITDIKLPAWEASTIISYLESNNMPARIPDRDIGLFNCWGFTAYYCQWAERAFWMDNGQIRELLEKHTKPISKKCAKPGDIAVFYRGEYLSHTAIVLASGNIVCHKPGGLALCIDTIEAAVTSYGDVSYARVIDPPEEN